MRTIVFWAHLLTGLTIGLIVVIMALTGVLLAYRPQIQHWADTRGLAAAPPPAGAAPSAGAAPLARAAPLGPAQLLGSAQLVARVRASTDTTITGIRWRREEDAPVEIQLGRERTLYVNGYTGAVLGEGSARTRAFFRTMMDLHRWIALSDVRTGRAITGAANLAFLFMVMSGLYLWWPRRVAARAFRSVLMFRRGLRAKARDFNWHNVIGFWSSLPLVVVIASAVVISYGWAGALVARASGNDAAAAMSSAAAVPQIEPGRELERADVLLARARAQSADWESIMLELPTRGGRAVFLIDTGTGGQPHKQARLTLAAATGDVVAWEPFSSGMRAARVREILRYAHTGEVAGIAGQTIAGLVSLGAVLMVWTGMSLALRRFAAWRRRRARCCA